VEPGFSHYSLVQGTGDPIEPVSKTANDFVSGGGMGVKLGVGWEFPSGFTPRVTYSLGGDGTLEAADGSTIARGWRHKVLLFEVGFRAAPSRHRQACSAASHHGALHTSDGCTRVHWMK